MFFRRFFRFVLVALLLLGVFGVFSSAAYRSGWSQGFVFGQTFTPAHGGKIDVQSEPNQGIIFTIQLPLGNIKPVIQTQSLIGTNTDFLVYYLCSSIFVF